jgi:hypothetical protein
MDIMEILANSSPDAGGYKNEAPKKLAPAYAPRTHEKTADYIKRLKEIIEERDTLLREVRLATNKS